jgi:hypothetical protein
MKKSTARDEVLENFAKLYYFVPSLEEFKAEVVPEKLAHFKETYGDEDAKKGKAKDAWDGKLKIIEPMDAILWLTEIVSNEREECLFGDVEKYVCRWYPRWPYDPKETNTTFSSLVNELEDAGYIDKEKAGGNKKKAKLSLTSAGKAVLARIKANRKTETKLIFQRPEGPLDKEKLQNLADSAWKAILSWNGKDQK